MDVLETEIAIRAFTEKPDQKPLGALPFGKSVDPSVWTLVFDCETTIDATQHLKFGFFQIYKRDALHFEGVFIDSGGITAAENERIRTYAAARGLVVMSVEEFRTNVFLKYGYIRQGTIVGFNLPFDISRLAIRHGPARGHMRGGFSFALTKNRDDPRVRVKHLNPRAAMIDFMQPGKQRTGRGMRKRGIPVRSFRGYFVDVKTIASALLSRRFSLKSLADTLQTSHRKHDTDEHGEVSDAYLDYARADVQVTWECWRTLSQRYAEHRLPQAISKVLSEATIGKAYLQAVGIRPFLGCDPTFDRRQLGQMMCAYYGGRAEVRLRREVHEVLYCDFKSMYPTVNALMGLWDFVIADGIQATNTTEETRVWLDSVTLADLQEPTTWRQLRTLVQVVPSSDLFPIRTKYDKTKDCYTIGLNYLTAEFPLWFTLADCAVSKLLTGKAPRIQKAISYSPGNRQSDLHPIKILRLDNYSVDPNFDDLFARLIDLRDEAKEKRDPIEKTLKIIANSTSYGIFIEINRDDAPKSETLRVFGPSGECAVVNSTSIEEPGRFFHPLLGILITGAARLMLGMAEKLTTDQGLDWAFCDTDSLAIAKPAHLSRGEFRERAQRVIDWFTPLNPYRKRGSILRIEDINCGIDSKHLEPLYCYAISAKRYALFNIDPAGIPVLRKASAHGLGHLIEPYSQANAAPQLPRPKVPLHELGVQLWQHDFWLRILQSALDNHPDQVALDWHSALSQPAAQRYSASSPRLLAWLDRWNDRKPYENQIRPFAFQLAYMLRTSIFGEALDPETHVVETVQRGRPPSADRLKPIAPYDSDPARALATVLDRVSGAFIPSDRLKTYAEALCQYHLSPEDKFANADYLHRGRTLRRHVFATGIVLIGKEANRVGESGEPDPHSCPHQTFSTLELGLVDPATANPRARSSRQTQHTQGRTHRTRTRKCEDSGHGTT
jgi:hypothetical protein